MTLVEDGLIEHHENGYRLCGAGAELEPVLFALADWSERHLMGPPRRGEIFRVRYLMTSIRRRLRPTAQATSLQLWIDGVPFWVRLGRTPAVRQGTGTAEEEVRLTGIKLRALMTGRARAEGVMKDLVGALGTVTNPNR